MASLSLERIVKRYGETSVIHGVDLDVRDGEFMVFVGPSGCGKSTLLRMIAGLESVTEGDLRIDGVRVNDVPAAQRGLAMVFQSYALYPHMTVYQNLAFGLENIGTPRTEIDAKVDTAARMLQLDALLARRPTQLENISSRPRNSGAFSHGTTSSTSLIAPAARKIQSSGDAQCTSRPCGALSSVVNRTRAAPEASAASAFRTHIWASA